MVVCLVVDTSAIIIAAISRDRISRFHMGTAVTIAIPDGGTPFDAELVEDEFTMLWLHHANSRGRRMGKYLLSAVLTIGWRVVRASPKEQALLEAHGFGSRRIQ
jgi:hypothetical protein